MSISTLTLPKVHVDASMKPRPSSTLAGTIGGGATSARATASMGEGETAQPVERPSRPSLKQPWADDLFDLAM